jgi:ABC-2 type transport system permease protein
MKKLWALIRVGLKENFLLFSLKHRMESSRLILVGYIGATAAAAFVLGSIYYFLGGFFRELYKLLANLHQEHVLLTLFIIGGQLLILIFGIFYMLSVFYFSKDLDRLVPLPVKPYQVVLSKYITVLINEYLTVSVVVLPVFIYYGILSDAGTSYWILMPVVFLLLPIIPLTISALVSIVLMRIVNLSKRKELFMVVGVILLMLVSLSPQFMKHQVDHSIDHSQMIKFLTSQDGVIHMITARFPPAAWATDALAFSNEARGITNFAVYSGVSLLLFLALLAIGQKFFYHSLIGFQEISAKPENHKKGTYVKRITSGSHPIRAIFMREFKIMNRTPVFLLNGMVGLVFLPLVILFICMNGQRDGQFFKSLLVSMDPIVTLLASSVFMLLTMTMSGVASSTFSREGRQFWMARVLPVSFKTQVAAKFLHSFAVSSLGIISASLVILIYFKTSLTIFFPALLLSIVGASLFIVIGMIIDLTRPLLNWESPQRAIKQNFNVFLAVILKVVIIIGAFFLYNQMVAWNFGAVGIYLSLLGLTLLLTLALSYYLFATATRKYEKITL